LEKYAGDRNIITFDGDHISHRPMFFYDSVCIFFNNNLNISTDFGDDNPYLEDELSAEELGQLQTRMSYSDQMERARQISIKEAYVDDDEESLQLALKLSLLESQAPASASEAEQQTEPKPELKPDSKPSDNTKDSKKDPKKDQKKSKDPKKDQKDKDKKKK